MKGADAERLIERFVEATRGDQRIVAAFVYGSHADGSADEHASCPRARWRVRVRRSE